MQEEIRILVVDRLYAQSEAIKTIYPNCIIVFCKVHIRRDLINQFGYKSEIVKKFDDIHNNYILCESFIKYLNDFKVQLQQENKNGVHMINDLLETRSNWLPIDLINQGVPEKFFTTNRIEGNFGRYKQFYGHSRKTLIKFVKDIINQSRLSITQSISSKVKNIELYKDLPLINQTKINLYGDYLLKVLNEEFNAYKHKTENQFCVWCVLRNKNSPFQLPCRHSIINGDVFEPTFFHQRYVYDKIPFFSEKSSVTVKQDCDKPDDMSYQNIMAKIQPYAAMASNKKEVADVFTKAFNEFDTLKIEKNQDMPLTMTIKGRRNEHPFKNVIGGRSRTKMHYKCSHCHQFGHNKQRCPQLLK